MSEGVQDIVAIGGGPSNLSLAALGSPIDDLNTIVLESAAAFQWHGGTLVGRATVQTAPLKDLVTLVAPTSYYSFLNFLASEGRMYRYLIAARGSVTRREFEEYFQWAAAELDVRFGTEVVAVEHGPSGFAVQAADGRVRHCNNLVLGVGRQPYVPECAEHCLGAHAFHASEYATRMERLTDAETVLVVGAGQSAADIVLDILEKEPLPQTLAWISGRDGFAPMDDSPFSNELFTPTYARYFTTLDRERRLELLSQQMLASDGINEEALQKIYRRLYELDYAENRRLEHMLLSGWRLAALESANGRCEALIISPDTSERLSLAADAVILATGYREHVPAFLAPVEGRLNRETKGELTVRGDYSLEFDGPPHHRIFIQGGARTTHGIADANLSLASWRSAVILNEICGRKVYEVDGCHVTLRLPDGSAENQPSCETMTVQGTVR